MIDGGSHLKSAPKLSNQWGPPLWVIYGFYIDSIPVIIANVISLILSFTLLVFKIRQG